MWNKTQLGQIRYTYERCGLFRRERERETKRMDFFLFDYPMKVQKGCLFELNLSYYGDCSSLCSVFLPFSWTLMFCLIYFFNFLLFCVSNAVLYLLVFKMLISTYSVILLLCIHIGEMLGDNAEWDHRWQCAQGINVTWPAGMASNLPRPYCLQIMHLIF